MPLRYRALMPACIMALALGTAAAASGADDIHATGFGSGGIAMGTWRWLNHEQGTGYISWVFDNSAIRTDDLAVHFEGLAALPPGHPGTLTLRTHYGFPGTALAPGPFAEIQLTLTATDDPAVVGVAVEGDLAISAAMMDAVVADARRLAIRIEQSENPGISVAFRQIDATLSTTAPGTGGTEGGDGGDTDDSGDDAGGNDEDGGGAGDDSAGGGGANGETSDGGGTSDGTSDGSTDGTTDGGGGNGGGGGGTGLAIELADGGRTLTTNLPFLLAQPGGDADPDEDGVLQEFENLAMDRLNPVLELDEEETWLEHRTTDNTVNFVKVTPYPGVWTPRYLLVMYATTWARDYGRAALPDFVRWLNRDGFDWWNESIANSHNGDIEKVVLAWEVKSPTRAELAYVYTSAHFGDTLHSGVWNATGTSCNVGRIFLNPVDQTICAAVEFEDGRVKVQVSQDKHAVYLTGDACEQVRLFSEVDEDCGGGGSEILPAYNIGETGHYLMDDIGWLFPGETLTGPSWRQGGDFCGGNTATSIPPMPCTGSIASSLDGPPALLEPALRRAPLELPYGTAEFFEHDNFQGRQVGLSAGEEIADLSKMWVGGVNMNDALSSLKLGPGLSCRFYEHADFSGRVLGPVTAGDAENGEWPSLSQQGFNDQVSSVRCVPEY